MSNEQDYPFFASTKWQKETIYAHILIQYGYLILSLK